jgi:hypothetical protein
MVDRSTGPPWLTTSEPVGGSCWPRCAGEVAASVTLSHPGLVYSSGQSVAEQGSLHRLEAVHQIPGGPAILGSGRSVVDEAGEACGEAFDDAGG